LDPLGELALEHASQRAVSDVERVALLLLALAPRRGPLAMAVDDVRLEIDEPQILLLFGVDHLLELRLLELELVRFGAVTFLPESRPPASAVLVGVGLEIDEPHPFVVLLVRRVVERLLAREREPVLRLLAALA